MVQAKHARSGERTSSPGQHPLTTDKEACAPNLQRLYFSSSVTQTKQTVFFVRYFGREVNAHRSAGENHLRSRR